MNVGEIPDQGGEGVNMVKIDIFRTLIISISALGLTPVERCGLLLEGTFINDVTQLGGRGYSLL